MDSRYNMKHALFLPQGSFRASLILGTVSIKILLQSGIPIAIHCNSQHKDALAGQHRNEGTRFGTLPGKIR